MEKEKKRISRQIMLIIVWIALAVIMATAITVTGVSVLSSQIRKDREQSVVGAAKLAANAINADRINDWLENGKDEEYENTFETLSDIRDNTPYLKYLYVYQIREDGCHVVFDTDTEEPGSLADLQ